METGSGAGPSLKRLVVKFDSKRRYSSLFKPSLYSLYSFSFHASSSSFIIEFIVLNKKSLFIVVQAIAVLFVQHLPSRLVLLVSSRIEVIRVVFLALK